ncbi:DUF2937 family protein [Shewanella aegiceratis]|uniref:DUF2937 family protein n=1 Tax=Shewanella aegiceratis TaxID=2864203 RepID=UPI001C65EB8A|nr:DUF2937 family protein [Shewanella aegiceratis]QYJ82279.1 DUF2937 family protein [Shewanella aegiceratis]
MIRRLMDYLRLLLFVCGVLLGVQVPAFVDQYGKALAAHTQEAKQSLAEFQRDADRFFGGDIDRLIAHYKQNPDAVFNAGGESIEALYQRYQLLSSALTEFNQSGYGGFDRLVLAPLPEIRDQVWQHFSHSILLDGRAIAFGLVFGLLFAMFCELTLHGCGHCCRGAYRRLRRKAEPQPENR